MKKSLYIVFSFMSLQIGLHSDFVEVGRHDGGDYAFWIPGSTDGKIYPTAEQKKNIKDTYYDDSKSDLYRDVCLEKINFDVLRAEFPIFEQKVNGYPLIYLDTGATAQMPQKVLNEIVDYYEKYKSNAGRGNYFFAEKTTTMFEAVRVKVASFIGAKKFEIVFTSGTTAGINLVAHAWAEHNIKPGEEIIISEIEHNANLLPWQQLALRNNLVLKVVPINDRGVVEPDVLRQYLTDKTKLVAITHQSNVLGVTNDIASIAKLAHAVGAKVLVDAAQSIVHQKVDVAQLNCEFLAFSGHKLYGPTGVGALFIKEDLFDEIVLQNFGGGMVYDIGEKDSIFKEMPHCLESGTQPIAQVIGLGAAIDFVQHHIDFKQAQEHETVLVQRFTAQLKQIPGITIISVTPLQGEHNNMVVFISDNCHAYDIAEHLNKFGIAVRAGYHCVHQYHEKLGGRASVRASFSIYNTEQEVDFVIDRLKSLLMH